MSETETQGTAPAAMLPPVPNLKITGGQNGETLATWGDPPRTMGVKEPTMSEQFELAEVTGPQADNQLWLNMAFGAASVRSFNGVPAEPFDTTRGRMKHDIGRRLDKMGQDGLRIALLILAGYRGGEMPTPPDPETPEKHWTAVGNSEGTAPSPNA